jgi:hypothetical protein
MRPRSEKMTSIEASAAADDRRRRACAGRDCEETMQALDERARVLEAEHGLYLGVVALTVPCTNASRDCRTPDE